jgi:hypothetical protein
VEMQRSPSVPPSKGPAHHERLACRSASREVVHKCGTHSRAVAKALFYWVSEPSSADGGEGVSQSPLKDKAYSTFLGQKPPFELRRKLAFRLQSFHEINRGSSNWTNPSISVGGGQQDWLAFALRRQRSHVRIVSGAPTTLMRDLVTAPACLTDEKSGRLNPAHYLLL